MNTTLTITSPEALDSAVAEVVRLKLNHTYLRARMETEIAELQKTHTARITTVTDQIADREADVYDYCNAHRAELFADKKSRDTITAVFGFEFTPWRVETTNRKITFKEVVNRLIRRAWGKAYLTEPAPGLKKDALLADRETLAPAKCDGIGIKFARDEQFYIRPKSEIAEPTTKA